MSSARNDETRDVAGWHDLQPAILLWNSPSLIAIAEFSLDLACRFASANQAVVSGTDRKCFPIAADRKPFSNPDPHFGPGMACIQKRPGSHD